MLLEARDVGVAFGRYASAHLPLNPCTDALLGYVCCEGGCEASYL